jgi:hypothetical protein
MTAWSEPPDDLAVADGRLVDDFGRPAGRTEQVGDDDAGQVVAQRGGAVSGGKC